MNVLQTAFIGQCALIAVVFVCALWSVRAKKQYLATNSTIGDELALEEFKSLARLDMYLSLVTIVSLIGVVICALPLLLISFALAAALPLLILTPGLILFRKWLANPQEAVWSLRARDEEMQKEVAAIIECWRHKPFPNF
jgi:divalent metal cation (Fe/Co/Zn/Cd) transporter